MESDADLVALVRAGDDAAFARLLRRYGPLTLGATKGLYAVGWEHQDLVAAASVGVWEAALSWSGRGSFGKWAEFIARRKVITVVKTSTRRKALPLRAPAGMEAVSEAAFSWDGGVGERLDGPELPPGLVLTAMERDVLDLSARGYAQSEIAPMLGISTRAVDNARQRVRRKALALRTPLTPVG